MFNFYRTYNELDSIINHPFEITVLMKTYEGMMYALQIQVRFFLSTPDINNWKARLCV